MNVRELRQLNWPYHCLALLLYTLLAVFFLWPTIAHIQSHVVGSGGDPWQTMWRFAAKQEVVSEALNEQNLSALIRYEFLGGGEPRLVNLSVWPWLPLHAIAGQPLTYNLIWLLSFVLAGYTMALLCRHVLESAALPTTKVMRQGSAIVAGVMYMFLPFHLAHAYGHFGAMQTQWLPLAILIFLKFIKKPSGLTTAALIAVTVIQSWTEHHYMLWLVVLLIIFCAWHAAAVIAWIKIRRNAAYVLGMLAILTLTVVVPYWPTIKQAAGSSVLDLGINQTIRFSADPFAYVIPAAFHPFWGNIFFNLFSQSFTGNVTEATQFLGLVPLLLIIFFFKRYEWPAKYFWLLVAAVFFIISLGPYLHLVGRVTPLPLPYLLLDKLPIFGVVRAVARAGVIVGIATAILLSVTLATQAKRRISLLIVSALIFVEFLFLPVPGQPTQLSPAYDVVRQSQGSSLIEIPAATNYVTASRALYASSSHGKNGVGNIALERGQDFAELGLSKSLPGVRQLLYLRTTELIENRPEFFNQDLAETLPDVMKWIDAPLIILHLDSVSPGQRAAIENFMDRLHIKPMIYDDIAIYDIGSRAGIATDGVFIVREGGWENVGFDPKEQAIFAEVPSQASINIINTTDQVRKVVLTFTIPPESLGRLDIKTSSNVEYSDNTQAGPAANFNLSVPPGETGIMFINTATAKVIIKNPQLKVAN